MSAAGPLPRRLFLRRLLLTHAVPCMFLGVLSIQLLDWLVRTHWMETYVRSEVKYIVLVLLNGLVTGAAVRLHQLAKQRLEGRVALALYDQRLNRAQQLAAAGVGAACGGLGVVLLLSEWGVLALTLAAVTVTLFLWRLFVRIIVTLLQPKRYAYWQDVQQLLTIYATLLFCFSLINASLSLLHKLLHLQPAFAHPGTETPFVFDSFYFTVVVVTTLGFGDIHPLSVDAKLFVMLQTLSSYVMFALIVGVATRGVTARDGQ